MELPESAVAINQRLIDYFGVFENGQPNFKVVWSDDEVEKRWVYESAQGFQLLTPVLDIVRKYSYIRNRFILERLIPVPDSEKIELTSKLSYEPLWVFEDRLGNALPPVWEAINILIRTLQDQMLYKKGPYKIPEGQGNTEEELAQRAKELESLLYGNETSIGDALATGSAVGYGSHQRDDTRFNNNPIKLN